MLLKMAKILAGGLALSVGLSACTAVPTETLVETEAEEPKAAVSDALRLLQAQQKVLSQHSSQLGYLAINQQQLVASISAMQAEVSKVTEVLSHKMAAQAVSVKTGKPSVKSRVAQKSQTRLAQKVVVGRNEWVWLDLLTQTLKSRVDTGARTSSLSATNIEPFERDGKKWVRFSLPEDKSDRMYETRLVRYTRINQASAEEQDRRPVVKLDVRLGPIYEETEFTLANRENMLYPVLLGRSFLKDIAIVDVAHKFVQPKSELQNAQKNNKSPSSAAQLN